MKPKDFVVIKTRNNGDGKNFLFQMNFHKIQYERHFMAENRYGIGRINHGVNVVIELDREEPAEGYYFEFLHHYISKKY